MACEAKILIGRGGMASDGKVRRQGGIKGSSIDRCKADKVSHYHCLIRSSCQSSRPVRSNVHPTVFREDNNSQRSAPTLCAGNLSHQHLATGQRGGKWQMSLPALLMVVSPGQVVLQGQTGKGETRVNPKCRIVNPVPHLMLSPTLRASDCYWEESFRAHIPEGRIPYYYNCPTI